MPIWRMFWTSSQFIGRVADRDAIVLADVRASCADTDPIEAADKAATNEQIVAARSSMGRCIIENSAKVEQVCRRPRRLRSLRMEARSPPRQ